MEDQPNHQRVLQNQKFTMPKANKAYQTTPKVVKIVEPQTISKPKK